MKLTNSQRADYLARFVAARLTVDSATPIEEDFAHAGLALAMFEAEIAKWPDETPAYRGIKISQEDADKIREAAAKIKLPVRNPEGIDFSLHPIPPGYTVASKEDCKEAGECTPAGWCQFSGTKLHDNWTYLRPLRDGEK